MSQFVNSVVHIMVTASFVVVFTLLRLVLLLQLMCLLTFWLLLRQAMTEKGNSQKDQGDKQLSSITVHLKGKTRVTH